MLVVIIVGFGVLLWPPGSPSEIGTDAKALVMSVYAAAVDIVVEPTYTPLPTYTPMPTASPGPTVTPAPTPGPPAPTSTSPPVVAPNLRHLEGKRYMLDLINSERINAGVAPVVLGDNVAAQLHAEASLAHCFSAHWGIDGLKPYMRYSLAGGYQSNGENESGLNYCITESDRYRSIANVDQEIRRAVDGFMDSPGHRRNILRPDYKKVNIGLAWGRYNFNTVQHFEGDYVEYERLPSIENGVLSMSGAVKNGVIFQEDDLDVQIHYDPPPGPLTPGQLAQTYCYDAGLRIAALRKPLPDNWSYHEEQFVTTYQPCPDPYEVPRDARAPRSHDEAHIFWQESYDASQALTPWPITAAWITAREWTASGDTFSVSADIGDLLTTHGKGVYTLIVWGGIGGESIVISEYSMFHDVAPPDTYSNGR